MVNVEVRTGIAIISMGTNNLLGKLPLRFLDRLYQAVRQASGDDAVDAVVLAATASPFLGKVDTPYTKPRSELATLGEIVNAIEGCQKPVVAAIQDAALGWELELALGCHFRISSRTAKLGLPDVKIGLIPGAGGTQRLPRAVGPGRALEMMVRGESVSGDAALELGLVDANSESDTLLEAEAFARRILIQRQPLRRLRDDDARLEAARKHFSIVTAAAASVLDEATRTRPAPLACVEAVSWSLHVHFQEGLVREQQAFLKLWEARSAPHGSRA